MDKTHLTTTFLNLLEYSSDYAALQHAVAKETAANDTSTEVAVIFTGQFLVVSFSIKFDKKV